MCVSLIDNHVGKFVCPIGYLGYLTCGPNSGNHEQESGWVLKKQPQLTLHIGEHCTRILHVVSFDLARLSMIDLTVRSAAMVQKEESAEYTMLNF